MKNTIESITCFHTNAGVEVRVNGVYRPEMGLRDADALARAFNLEKDYQYVDNSTYWYIWNKGG